MKQESNRQKTMEDIDGGRHPAVDGQSLGENERDSIYVKVHAYTTTLGSFSESISRVLD